MSVEPLKFLRDVRSEVSRVTWPGQKEVLITTGMVLAMAIFAAIFFFLVDQAVAAVMRLLLQFGR